MSASFEPKIIAFLCNWCSYAGADLAGVSRIQYPPSIRVVRTMCSGRVDPLFIIEALKNGFDGVFVGGCHIGDCHYQDGNLYTKKRMEMLFQLLDLSGIGSSRVHLRWASAAEAQVFADYVTEVTQIIRDLGPFDRQQHALPIDALSRTLYTQRIRWLTGIDRQVTERENVYHEKTDPEFFSKVLQDAIKTEYHKALLLESLKEGPLTVYEMAEKTGLPAYTVSLRLNDLELSSQAKVDGYDGTTPRFISLAA